ncbi:unnamed protein product [Rotaria sp. Silwood1]|nr:unnamed protein product [Rotaria sp. Silwood1]CAF1587775.1 unnamed protein product [Rotaria sp. Silwood1]CAF3675247.1 unnamed protein product [Rotaria sp. Silwood1]CAF4627408.1 unnamed protein product [Rotaria sp. Silwood1]
MSEATVIRSADQLPIVPETQIIEPIVQCGVLYLGSAPPSPGHRGLDSIQEPFSHRYPVDGTNVAQGIDAVLSIYDNGIQLTLARQPHTVIFYPISALIYCASLRFSAVEYDQTSSIDWRFAKLDPTVKSQSKHPPLFCFVVQRTILVSGDECHFFVTKDDDSALALVRTISEVYANLKPNVTPIKSPIFYQLDRYGRKISETGGVIYISPAVDDEFQFNQLTDCHGSISSINRNYLLDPSNDGFFYRTNATIIEQWQLWHDVDLNKSRPRPPDSPFGVHQGLYHDDLTNEVHQHLHHMDDEEISSSCSCSSSSRSSMKSDRHRRTRSNAKHDIDQLNTAGLHLQTTSFNPLSVQNNIEIKRSQQAPIVIEKVIPNPMITFSKKRPRYILEQPQELFDYSISTNETDVDTISVSDSYQVNERGEKYTKEGNRILFMDVIQPKLTNNKTEPLSYITPKSNKISTSNITQKPYIIPKNHSRSHRRRTTHIPVIDLKSIHSLINQKKYEQRQTSIDSDENQSDHYNLTTSDMLEIVEEYFEDHRGRKLKINNHNTQTTLDHLESVSENDYHDENRSNNKSHRRRRRQSYSTLISGPSLNYVERPSVRSTSKKTLIESKKSHPSVLNNEHVSNNYGTSGKISQTIKSPTLSTKPDATQISNNPKTSDIINQDFISPFRYMQSSVNPLLLREYRKAFNAI